MNILLHGVNNYLAERLTRHFLAHMHQVSWVIRDKQSYLKNTHPPDNLCLIQGDIIREKYADNFPKTIDAAFYFSFYATEQGGVYKELELLSLKNFIKKLRKAYCQHLIYVIPLRSPANKEVKALLQESYIAYTIVRTSNIIGRESLLLQIFQSMTEKIMIVSNQRLAKSRCQPIAIDDLIAYLDFIMYNPVTFNQSFDVGGTEILSYREMLGYYFSIRKVRRPIILLPFVNNLFSSFWLSRSSGLPKALARAFSSNIQGDLLCRDNRIHLIFPHRNMSFKEALLQAMD